MSVIHADELTRAQRSRIAAKYAPYDNSMEFWIGFVDAQQARQCPYGEDNDAARTWKRGAEAAMNVCIENYHVAKRCVGCGD
jgi:hypothetical protein